MSLNIAIFEDDKDLGLHLKELLEVLEYESTMFMSTKKVDWKSIDVIIADYSNTLVSFKDLIKLAETHEIPLIAISGGQMNYKPALSKPFLIEELESVIMKSLQHKNDDKEEGFFKSLRKTS